MSIFTVHTADKDQETAIRLFLDALHVSYKSVDSNDMDATEYLMSSPEMVRQIDQSIEDDKNNKGVAILLDDIWK